MKLSQYAKQQGISYRTALRWFRTGAIKGYQAPSGTIIVTVEEPQQTVQKVAIYARVSSAEHRDRLTRFGFHYLETLLEIQGRKIEVVNVAENDKEDLIADLVAIVHSFTAWLYGQRCAKRKTERIVQELEANGHE
jgi:predicted site-specific integrase-resolvase